MWTKVKHFHHRLAYGVRMNQLLCTVISVHLQCMCVCVVLRLQKRIDRHLCKVIGDYMRRFVFYSQLSAEIKECVWLIFEQSYTFHGIYMKKKIERINLLSLSPPLTAPYSSFTDLQGVLFFIGCINQNTPETLEVN